MSKRPAMLLAVATAVLVPAVACRPVPGVAIIGLGYLSQQRAALVAAAGDSLVPGRAIRIVSQSGASPGSGATVQAAEVHHAAILAAMPGIVGVVGHGGSREALITAPIYNEAGIPQIVPTGTSRRLQTAGRWTFTLAPNDSIEGEFLGRFVAERLGARTVTLFYVLDEYGAGLRDGAVDALTRRGVRILDAVPVPITGLCPPAASANALSSLVDAALLRGRPDVVVLAARQRESGCIVARVHQRHPGVAFVAGDGLLAGADFSSRAGRGADSTYIVAFWHRDRPDSLSREFVHRYERMFGVEPNHEEAMIHDALFALASAVRAVGTDGEKIRRYLVSLGSERPALAGVTGPIAFPGTANRLMMTRIRGDRREVVTFP